jgi:hypothetical protein
MLLGDLEEEEKNAFKSIYEEMHEFYSWLIS